MFETQLTVVGNIVNDLQRRRVGEQEVLRFRVASNSRRRTADGSWEPGNSLFVGVTCWGRLVSAVGGALGKGSPVIVVGHIYTSEYEDRDGTRRSSLEMRATSVGADLARLNGANGKPAQTADSDKGQQGPEPDAHAEIEGETPVAIDGDPQAQPQAQLPPELQADPQATAQTDPQATAPADPQADPQPGSDGYTEGPRDAGGKRRGTRLSA